MSSGIGTRHIKVSWRRRKHHALDSQFGTYGRTDIYQTFIETVVIDCDILEFQLYGLINVRCIEKIAPTESCRTVIVTTECTIAEDSFIHLVVCRRVIERAQIHQTVATCLPTALVETASFHRKAHDMLAGCLLMTPESTGKPDEIAIDEADTFNGEWLVGIHEILIVGCMWELDILKFQCRNIRAFGNPPPIIQNHFRLDTLTATYQTETFGKFERSNTVGRTGR